jgi:CdiI N-terminal domain
MNISIKITNNIPVQCEDKQSLKGLIKIGDFEETICVHLNPWTRENYEDQWQSGLERLKMHDTSCLVVSVGNPNENAVVEWWRLYRVGNTVFVQNGNLSKNNYKKIVGKIAFTPETCYSFVPPRKTHTKEGYAISEWSVPWTEDTFE